MSINCVVSGWVDCSYQTPGKDCHITIYINYLANMYDIDLEEFLTENGWLYLNEEEAYCPECRKQIQLK